MQSLPPSLRTRIAEVQALPAINRNKHLFGGCDRRFLGGLVLLMAEVHLMPGEVVINHEEMARELSFASKGTLVVTDPKEVLVELISGEGTAQSVVGAVSFFMGARLLSLVPDVLAIVLASATCYGCHHGRSWCRCT